MFNLEKERIQMLTVGTDSEDELAAMKGQTVEFRKQFGKILSKSRKDVKSDYCFHCGKECSSYCNSHSIPAFVLKNIAVEGSVYSNIKLISLPLLDDAKGVKQAGTFQLICRSCDSKIFSEYEEPENYTNTPTQKMIAQIAMKNSLKSIAKRKSENAIYDNLHNIGLPFGLRDGKHEVNNLDLKENMDDYNQAKRVLEKELDDGYNLFYHEKLEYVVPIAFQSSVAVLFDFEDATINNIYNSSSKYTIKGVHISVFPLEDSSEIMLFVDSSNKRYRYFIKQFNKLSHEDKLAAINFMIFSLSEDVYISKSVSEEVIQNKELVSVSQLTPDILSVEPSFDPLPIARESFGFSRMKDIPNLLLEEYKIR
ncbi:hypothetical protein [Niallia sp. Man26]|uniref:hypothetical protein n=1 Tax=Niallia sp. Man26 TaxID=2912824 RepID=UPI001EDA1F61|nr:hypothetical protein [Niallia sp. Man26]UPO90996.1 hypothetical protein L8T27_027045 [Niallia sp. Man26]